MVVFVIALHDDIFCFAWHILLLDLPNRPAMAPPGGAKKQSGSSPGIGISLGDISGAMGRLRKVNSEDRKESLDGSDGSARSQTTTSTDSFKGKINMFKQAEGEENHHLSHMMRKPCLFKKT